MRKFLLAALLMFGVAYGAERAEMIIVMETTQGTIEMKLWPEIAPKACENMKLLAEKGYYDGVTFHRIIKDFMIQGGDPTGTGFGGESAWGSTFEDECTDERGYTRPGLLGMANSGPATNGSQFFITTVETPWLNGKHTIFGEVTEGYEVVQKLESVKTDGAGRPAEKQVIKKMYVKSSE